MTERTSRGWAKNIFRCFPSCVSPEVILVVVTAIITLPLLLPLRSPVLSNDFLLYCTQHAIVREAMLQHGTLPLETPALAGGYPVVANPESPVLNPLVALSLIGGEVAGLKLIYLFYAVASGLGVYWLCRYSLGLTTAGSFFAGACLVFSAVMPGKYAGGNPHEAQLMVFPLGLHLLLQGRRKPYFLALVGLGWLLLTDTKFIAWIFWIYIFLAAAVWDIGRLRSARLQQNPGSPLLAIALGAFCLTLLLGAVKILPVIEFFRENGGLRPSLLFNHAVSYTGVKGLSLPAVLEGLADPRLFFWKGSADGAFTIGPVVFLAALGSLAFLRHSWRVWALASVSVWLTCANNIRSDLFHFLWTHIPGFNLIDKPAKYFAPLAAAWLCVAAGIAVSRISLRLESKRRIILVGVLLLVSLPFPLAMHRRAWKGIIRVHPSVIGNLKRAGSFFQVASRQNDGNPLAHPDRAISYFNFKSGVGTIDAYLPVSVPRRAIPRYFILPNATLVENPSYVGELEHPGGMPAKGDVDYRPNRILVRLREPIRGALILNRNFDRGWVSPDGEVMDHQGRLSVIPRGQAGQAISLTYRPEGFRLGARISIVAFLGVVIYLAGCVWRRWRPIR